MEKGGLHAVNLTLIFLYSENVLGLTITLHAGVASFSSGSMLDEKPGGISPSGAAFSLVLNVEAGDFGPSKIIGCHFDGNTATDGGAIYTAAGYDMVVDSSFTRNFAGRSYQVKVPWKFCRAYIQQE